MFVSGVLALFILTLLCTFYYVAPLVWTDEDNATDVKFEPNALFVHATEGLSYGRTNNDGYNCSINYEKGMPLHVLIMGASHMEAMHVMREDNTADVLARLSDRIVYNIGRTTHFFPRCAVHLEPALKKYTPSEYVVIETGTVDFADKELERIINKNIPRFKIHEKGIMPALRRNNFLRLMNTRIFKVGWATKEEFSAEDTFNSPKLLTEVLKQLKETASSYGVKLIIAYHPSITLHKDGSISINGDANTVAQFSNLCAQNEIYFVDTGKRFLSEYENQHVLPYGFMNTSVGKGHMNRYGHRMFAEEIYKLIQRIEAQS